MSSVPCFLVFFYYLFDGFGGKLFTKLTTTKTALGSKKDNEKLKHNDVILPPLHVGVEERQRREVCFLPYRKTCAVPKLSFSCSCLRRKGGLKRVVV
jgi:hypothetical protein